MEDEGQGPRRQHQATPPDPGRSGESQPPSTDSTISVEELFINTPKQQEGPTHRTVTSQEPDDSDSPAGTQARCFKQDLACSEVRYQDFGEVRVQDFREVRIQDGSLACKGDILRADWGARSAGDRAWLRAA